MIVILVSVILVMAVISGFVIQSCSTRTKSGSETVVQDQTNMSLEEVLSSNNDELLKLEDKRKTVVFALYGIDDKTTEEGRSDIIMVVKYDPALKKMVIVSIPRDTRVDVPGYGLTKINHAYAYGGEALINQVVEELLGIKLDFTVKLNFETFSNIIDTLGGVQVNAKKQFFDSENILMVDQGPQILNGEKALFYVRFRSDADVDFGRIARQQEVMISLMEYLKASSMTEKLTLISKYYNKGIKTDANLTKMTDYIKMSGDDKDIIYENYRLQTSSQVIDGLWYELYSEEDLNTIRNLFDKKEEMNLENWK